MSVPGSGRTSLTVARSLPPSALRWGPRRTSLTKESPGHWYRADVDDVRLALSFQELAEAVGTAPSPTADDVSITWDGRRLDSKEKVLAFLAEIDTARSNGVTLGPPLS